MAFITHHPTMKIDIAIILILLFGCQSPSQKVNSLINNDSISSSIEFSLIRFDTTLKINNQNFQIKVRGLNNELSLLTAISNSDTALIDTVYGPAIAYFEYPDFDLDGNLDILFDYFGNNSTYYLYLFDISSNHFVNINRYSEFPDSRHVKTNPKYYYSYHRAGCADMNWVSDLFTIENFKIIHLGHIYGQGCDADTANEPQIIDIYRIPDNNENAKILIEELPYLKYIPKFGDKWDFIEKYWNSNYQKFE
jgi:hypothetical protein